MYIYISYYNKNDCLNTLVYNGSGINNSSNKYSSNHFYEK